MSRFQPGFQKPHGSAGVSMTFEGAVHDFTNATSYSFTSIPFGTATSTRYILVGLAWSAGGAGVPTVTIGGVTATDLGGIDSGSFHVHFFIANVTSGTSGTIAVNHGAVTATQEWCFPWRLDNLLSSAAVDLVSGITATTPSAAQTLADLEVKAGGAAFVVGWSSGTVMSGCTGTWTGVDTPTEQNDTQGETTSTRFVAYDMLTTANSTTDDFTTTFSTVGGGSQAVAALSLR